MSESLYCQVGQYQEVTSAITGHKLLVNTSSDKFLVIEDTNFSRLPSLVAAMDDWLTEDGSKSHKVERHTIAALRAFAAVTNVIEMCSAIDMLVVALRAVEKKRMGQKPPVISWLQRMWEEGFIAFPVNLPFDSKIKLPWDQFGFPMNHEWIMALPKASSDAKVNMIPGLALRAATTAIGVREAGDLVPEGVASFFILNWAQVSTLATPLLALQRARYGEQAKYTLKDWGAGRKSRGSDRTYRWVLEHDLSLADWQEKIADWMKEGRSLALRTYMADRLFSCLIAHKTLPRTVSFQLAPVKQLARADAMLARHQRNAHSRLVRFTHQHGLFSCRPPTTLLVADRYHLDCLSALSHMPGPIPSRKDNA